MNEIITLNFSNLFLDEHVHFREDDRDSEMVMGDLVSSGFGRGISIGNYKNKPITTAWDVEKDLKRLNKIRSNFEVIPTAILTWNTTPQTIRDLHSAGVKIIKILPDLLTTHSGTGITWFNIHKKKACFREMERLGMFTINHVEASRVDSSGNPATHPLFRESLALPKFDKLARTYPGIPMMIAHVSTAETVDYILYQAPPNVKGEITAHHLSGIFEDVYDKSWNIIPENWCAPVFKFSRDREALREAATGWSGKFFYGGDKALHRNKNRQNPPSGCYAGQKTDVCIIADTFEQYSALERMGEFMHGIGSRHYHLPLVKGTVVLQRESWTPPGEVNGVKIYHGGKKLNWRVAEVRK